MYEILFGLYRRVQCDDDDSSSSNSCDTNNLLHNLRCLIRLG